MTLPARKPTPPVHRLGIFTTTALGLCLAACGGEGVPHAPHVPPEPDPVLSCRDLHLTAPMTGGTFHCAACSREWDWHLVEPVRALYLVLDLECLATTGARLSLLDPHETPVWEMEVRAGERGRACVAHESAPPGRYRLRLDGSPPGPGIAFFAGSVWANVYTNRGERLSPAGVGTH